MDDNGTRDIAVRAITKIEEHIAACERRYEEGNQRLERMFTYIKDAHTKTESKIDEIQTSLAEARGAGKIAKVIGAGAAAAIGGVSGLFGGSFIHR